MDRLLSAAEGSLRQLAAETVKGDVSPESAAAILQRAVYRSPYFREAGLIVDGQLIATSLGPVTPEKNIDASQRSDSSITGLQILGLIKTQVMNESSVVLAWATGPGSEVNLLVDPTLLAAAVIGPDEMSEGGSLIQTTSGKTLLAAGRGTGGQGDDPHQKIVATDVSPRYGVRNTLSVAKSWATRGWLEDAFILTPGALLCCGIIAALVGEVARRTHSLEDELRVALDRHEFEAHYQPTIELRTRRCVGAEVLLRWKHPQSGYIRPDLFVAAAESSGLIEPITKQLMEQVVQDMQSLLRAFPDLHLGINLAPEQFVKSNLLPTLTSIFHERSIRPRQILLEATERTPLDGEVVRGVFEKLRDAGFTVAMDDFGTGYSSLSYLSRLRFDILKIDASFVKRIGQDHVSSGLLDTIVDLGKRLEVTLVAEGIETEPQLAYLIEQGVQLGQGWLFSKAVPAGEFIAFLNNHSAAATPGTMSGQAAI